MCKACVQLKVGEGIFGEGVEGALAEGVEGALAEGVEGALAEGAEGGAVGGRAEERGEAWERGEGAVGVA